MMGAYRNRAESGSGPGGKVYLIYRSFIIFFTFLFILGCRGPLPLPESTKPSESPKPLPTKHLPRMDYTIQVGAFASLSNAVRLAKNLQAKGLDAYCFPHSSGLFKVRFGNYLSKESARKEAEELLADGIIADFYLVSPEDYPGGKELQIDEAFLRQNIVQTAKGFLGLPYRWGGDSVEEGFDCSGLVMAAYQLNGLALPRSSRQQWERGNPIGINQLSQADLLFFSTSGNGKVSHVGLYTGKGRFIHAPGRGKRIRSDALSNPYFRRNYMGARTYL